MFEHSHLTFRLALALLAATFGTWFTHSFSMSALNVPQFIVQNWIRSVKCHRFGGIFRGNYITGNLTNADYFTNATADPTLALWCSAIPSQQKARVLSDNTELNTLWALFSSMLCVGALFGTLLTNPLIRCVGVKRSLMCGAVVLAAGCVMCSFAPLAAAWELFLVGRIVIGLGIGVGSVVAPVYTAEITPPDLRGAAGTLPPIMYVLGLIATTAIGFPSALGTETGWPWLVSVVLIPVAVSCIALPFCPESPRYLYMENNDVQHATAALAWFRGTSDIQDEIEQMHMEVNHMKGMRKVSVWGLFTDPYLRKITVLTAVPMLVHQFCGFQCVIFYSTSIFDSVGLRQLYSVYATMGVWCCYFASLFISMFLVDRLGRRTLLLISQCGMIVALILFVIFASITESGVEGTEYGSAACLPFFIVCFALGSAAIPWILPGELFPQEAHSSAASFTASVCWASAILTTFLFPIVQHAAKQYTFLIFAGLVILGTVHVAWKLPETKGKTIDEIQTYLHDERLISEHALHE
ncbi:solute carrier family 2, facilitated glucose transporter member 1-like [Paramacrobiotus metropolitanus]|uniref:solute carrier family 2, facilitated glucose transporter member 1-like n=1 Tax=Paramacrobiotus metropolitanus TaxID=2943436 RepID=UPI002445C355|nr:solute carrier family 2, facilitated glucose transporter member 1-like [Paramacrobiotus metropolitanus]